MISVTAVGMNYLRVMAYLGHFEILGTTLGSYGNTGATETPGGAVMPVCSILKKAAGRAQMKPTTQPPNTSKLTCVSSPVRVAII